MRHVDWFRGAVENFRFFDIRVYAFADPEAAVAEFKVEGLIKPTGRIYRQDMCYSCVPLAERLRSYANILIPFELPRRWTQRLLVSIVRVGRASHDEDVFGIVEE
jgi:ketosteroid isomerase-like protein